MYYLIYKITNMINNKIYIGKHKTDDINDNYMGSGTMLKRAINKYGIENFEKEILFECSTEKEMNEKEKQIVNNNFISRSDTYNIKNGGEGGWDYCNNNHEMQSKKAKNNWTKYGDNHPMVFGVKRFWNSLSKEEYEQYLKRISDGCKKYYETHQNPMLGKKHSKETKRKIGEKNSIRQKGELNSNYGHCWIYNDETEENKNIKKELLDEFLRKGWKKGRKTKYLKKF